MHSPPLRWGDQSLEQLRLCLRRIRQQRRKLKQHHDPEALHQLRVNLRRLRACVELADAAMLLPKALKAQQVARQGRCFGRVRDLDVLCDQLSGQLLPHVHHSEAQQLKRCIKRLERQRKQAQRLAQAQLHSDALRQWLRRSEHWLSKACFTALGARPLLEVLPDLQLRQLSTLLLHPGWSVEDHRIQAQALHGLRKQIKASRYQADGFRAFYGPDYGAWIDDLRLLQDCLGGLQDLEVLRTLLRHDLHQGMPQLEQQLQDRAQEHWQLFVGLRQRYCDGGSRQQLRLLVASCQPGA